MNVLLVFTNVYITLIRAYPFSCRDGQKKYAAGMLERTVL